jgi:hypothetical protein
MGTLHIPVTVVGMRKDDFTERVEVTAQSESQLTVEFHTPLRGCPHIGDRLNVTIETTDH